MKSHIVVPLNRNSGVKSHKKNLRQGHSRLDYVDGSEMLSARLEESRVETRNWRNGLVSSPIASFSEKVRVSRAVYTKSVELKIDGCETKLIECARLDRAGNNSVHLIT